MNFDSTSDLKIVPVLSTEVNNRLVGPDEILRVIDTGALYVAGPSGKPQSIITGSTSSDGRIRNSNVGVGSIRNPGGGAYTLEDLRPQNVPFLNPIHYSGTIATSGSLSASVDATKSTRGIGKSILISASAAVTNQVVKIPIPTNLYGDLPKVGNRWFLEVECDDWTKITRLYFWHCQGGGNTHGHIFAPIEAGQSYYGMTDPAMSAAWNGKKRVLMFCSDKKTAKVGSPADWGLGDAETRYYLPDTFAVTVTSTAAVNFNIYCGYSSEWPVGAVVLIGDGAYKSYQNNVITPMAARGYRGGVSLYRPQEKSGVSFHPTKADLAWIAAQGWDIFPHVKNVHTALPVMDSIIGANSTLIGTLAANENTYADLLKSLDADVTWLHGAGVPLARWTQHLQNRGGGSFDMAAGLRTRGFAGARANTRDLEFGIDPFDATYTKPFTDGPELTGGWMCGWESPWGKYNRHMTAWFDGLSGPIARNSYGGSPTQKIIAYSAAYGDVSMIYTHQVLSSMTDPSNQYDSGTKFAEDLLADIFDKADKNELLILSPSELDAITYQRPGPFFLNAYNQWVFRDDPTKIAF
jgi:hypothetical protein